MYIIDNKLKTPLYIQLYNELKKDIINNLSYNDKLPSIRKLASTYKLSKNTVQSAYNQLYAEGYISSYEKSGYFVCDTNYENFAVEKKTIDIEEKIQYKYDFVPVRLSKESFPIKLFKRLTNKALNEDLDFGKYLDGQGELSFRQEIAKYLQSSRAVKCEASNIVICNGFPEAMGLVAKMLKDKYKTLAIEKPGYYITKKVFEDYSYNIDKINIDTNGIKIDDLKKSKSKLVYITPSHQYPTSVTMPISNRLKLLKWANENNAIIIEDDYDSELSYINRPIPSLQGLDNNNKVVYFGTFSKSLSPSLRVCYMVLPDFMIEKYKNSFDSHFPKVSLIVQKTLELFLKDGYYEKHIRKMRTLNRKKHNLMKKYLQIYLKDTFIIVSQGSGFCINIKAKNNLNRKKLKQLSLKNKIKIYFTNDITNNEYEAIRMGFGGFEENQIQNAVELFSKIWFEALDE